MNSSNLEVAQKIADMADEGGIIQAEVMLVLSQSGVIPNEPTYHTTTNLRRAWQLAGLDADECQEALFGY